MLEGVQLQAMGGKNGITSEFERVSFESRLALSATKLDSSERQITADDSWLLSTLRLGFLCLLVREGDSVASVSGLMGICLLNVGGRFEGNKVQFIRGKNRKAERSKEKKKVWQG